MSATTARPTSLGNKKQRKQCRPFFLCCKSPLAATAERGHTGGGSRVYVCLWWGRSGCLNPFMLWGCPYIIAPAELLKWGGFEVSLWFLSESTVLCSNDIVLHVELAGFRNKYVWNNMYDHNHLKTKWLPDKWVSFTYHNKIKGQTG